MKHKNEPDLKTLLKPFRVQIDALDDKIVALLGKRFDIVRQVADIKAKNDLPSYLSDRVVEVRERNAATGKKHGVDPDFMRMLYSLIIYQSCATEDMIKADLKAKAKKSEARKSVRKK